MKPIALFVVALTLLSAAPKKKQQAPRGTAGQFDYYLLSLSWSPQYCNTPAGVKDQTQCGGTRQYEFVLHGLWPQYEKSWPQFCETNEALAPGTIDKMLDIMPSRRLIEHEWERHGVCAGLTAPAYFDKARAAFQKVKGPSNFVKPANARSIAPEEVRSEFIAANPGMPPQAVSVGCSGRFLSEVRVCMTKDLKPRACSPQVERQSCTLDKIIVQPLR